MGQKEFKTEPSEQFVVVDPAGNRHTVVMHKKYMREQLVSGPWTPWLPMGGALRCGQRHVNPMDDGTFTFADQPNLQLTRASQA